MLKYQDFVSESKFQDGPCVAEKKYIHRDRSTQRNEKRWTIQGNDLRPGAGIVALQAAALLVLRRLILVDH